MKIEYEEKDKDYITLINDDIANNKDIPKFINEKGKRYYVEFTCNDIAKANLFVNYLLSPNPDYAAKINELFGIRIECLSNCSGDSKRDELKRMLEEFLRQLNQS